ncbi:hypothetical protein HDU93_005149 [Gonapodya sp. JEL0774]|nr:hypothetical protein HDU93_005149 [Gonapodya sp. JEL0774]
MLMFFHTGFVDYFLFKTWVPRNRWQYAGSLVAVLLLAFFFEGIIVAREILEHKWSTGEDKRRALGVKYLPEGLIVDVQRFFITVLSVTMGYVVMLLVMTFNVGVFFMCVIGIGVGSVVFRKFKNPNIPFETLQGSKECC